MAYLLDTNIILEYLLDQDKADEVERFLKATPPESLAVTEFSVHSVGILLLRRKLHSGFVRFVEDMLIPGDMGLVRLGIEDLGRVSAVAEQNTLSFDDAYQYVAADKYNLTLVSLDADFDRTARGRMTPGQVLQTARH